MRSAMPDAWQLGMGAVPNPPHFSTSPARFRLGGLNLESELLSSPVSMSFDAAFAIQDPYSGQPNSAVGLSFSLDGHIGFGNGVTLFGRSSWLTGMLYPDASQAVPDLEFTTGITLSPQPNFSILAGYRRFRLDQGYSRGTGSPYSTQGLFLGTGFYW